MGEGFFEGLGISFIVVVVLGLSSSFSFYKSEGRISESCEILGSFVSDGKAYKCELVKG